jgi:enoyl-CoA hydratase/carnithine racemase
MQYWDVEHKGGIAIASYDNPPKNYFVNGAIEELVALATDLASTETRVLILTGKPKGLFVTHFSVEALSDTAEESETPEAGDAGDTVANLFHEMTLLLNKLPIPVICAMTGSTMGGGFELALACDIRVVERGPYVFGLPEANVGILPGGGGTQRLARLIGASGAANMILRGMVVGAEEAFDRGLVHEIADDAKAHALEIAEGLEGLSPVSMREIKRAIYQGIDVPLEEGLRIEQGAFQTTMRSQEARTLMKAFAETPISDRP